MDYRILGPLEVLDGSTRIEVGHRQQRALLALLLVNSNHVVSTEKILEALWPRDPTGKENTLWVYVSRLRSALEPDRKPREKPSRLITTDRGYSLVVTDGEIDASRFEQLVKDCRQMVEWDPDRAARDLRQGLDAWRGEPLEDFEYADFAAPEIERLRELRLGAIEDRIDADIRCGAHRDVIGELQAIFEQHPLRERPVGLLMVALYRSGRQAEALRLFRHHKDLLGEQLGLEPSPDLCRIEEQVLLHDERLGSISPASAAGPDVLNPFKGLEAFREADAARFFGRDRLTSDLVRRMDSGGTVFAVVGASGSGKSSLLRAGLIPAIRKGALGDPDRLLVAHMVPGERPFAELEAALLRARPDLIGPLGGLSPGRESGLITTAVRLLDDPFDRVVLIIDQLEELFTLVESTRVRSGFMRAVEVAVQDPHRRVIVVVALRADFYEQVLEYPDFASQLGAGVVNATPMTAEELTAAAEGPAASVGVQLEPGLVARLTNDVVGRTGGLPLFQFALTELFDRRVGDTLTSAAYDEMGGMHSVLSQRAEKIFENLDRDEQVAAHQLFLRLVSIPDARSWSRRRILGPEVASLAVDKLALQRVVHAFGARRLLTFDRDAESGAPTVEVAHEALLQEWSRLRRWIREGQDDVARRSLLDAAMTEWDDAGRQPDYLLTGARLDDYESWAEESVLLLNGWEREFLDASIRLRDDVRHEEELRRERESDLGRKARNRLRGLVAATVVMLAAAVALFAPILNAPPHVVVLHGGADDLGMNDLMIAGLASAARDLDIEAEDVVPLSGAEEALRELATAGTDLVIVSSEFDTAVQSVASDHPDVRFVAIDPFALHVDEPNVTKIEFAVEESAFLAGAAAARVSETHMIAFIGAGQTPSSEAVRAGYEEGAHHVDPDVEVLSRYLGPVENPLATFAVRPGMAGDLAESLYGGGVDVIFDVAGASGHEIMEAALGPSEHHRWVIGSDIDAYALASTAERAHVLASAGKRYDTAVSTAIHDFVDNTLSSGTVRLDLRIDGVELFTSGGHLAAHTGQIELLAGEVAFDHLSVPRYVTQRAYWQLAPDLVVGLTLHDNACEMGPGMQLDNGRLFMDPGTIVRIDLRNDTDQIGGLTVRTVPPGTRLDELVVQAQRGIPEAFGGVLGATLVLPQAETALAFVMTEATIAPNCFFFDSDTRPGDFPAFVGVPS